MNGNVWKWFCGILGAMVLSISGSWFAFGGGVTQAELKAAVANHITRAEFNLMMDRIDQIHEDLREIRATLTARSSTGA